MGEVPATNGSNRGGFDDTRGTFHLCGLEGKKSTRYHGRGGLVLNSKCNLLSKYLYAFVLEEQGNVSVTMLNRVCVCL